MERLEAFEKMLAEIIKRAEYENEQMAILKAAGKEKTATYRQYLGNRLMYNHILAEYKKYGLIE